VAYPNPFANTFAIQVQTSSKDMVQLKVYDMIGRLVEQRETKVDSMETVQLGDRYPSGVYSVVVTQGDITETLRVIKR
jgi:ribosomal protein S3AE